jgi:hypothetical protein
MPEKPPTADEYSKVQTERVKATCLYVATVLGDYMKQSVIVGSLFCLSCRTKLGGRNLSGSFGHGGRKVERALRFTKAVSRSC